MAKTMTFAACHFTVAFSVAYLLTGDAGISSLLALVEPACNTVAYYFHEKAWNRFDSNRSDAGTGRSPAPNPEVHGNFSNA